jgi:hypothetical protein
MLVTATFGQNGSVNLSVNDVRPVAAAIMSLETKFGWVITYEDPPYAFAGDIQDITERVRKDLNRYGPGIAPRVVGPRGGALSVSYTANLNDPLSVIQSVLDAEAARSGNVFRVERDGDVFHVVPVRTKNKNGNPVERVSVLESNITLAGGQQTGVQMLQTICGALSKTNETPVLVGIFPNNLLYNVRTNHNAASKSARESLLSLFANTNRKLSWQLFYDPGLQEYALNVHVVPDALGNSTSSTPTPAAPSRQGNTGPRPGAARPKQP